MKKYLLLLFVALAYNISQAQLVSFGLQAGLNYNYAKISKLSGLQADEAALGYYGGLFLRVQVPIVGFYAQIDPAFTMLKENVEDIYFEKETTVLSSFRFDLPLLFGVKIAAVRFYFGPMISVNLNNNIDWEDASVYAEDMTAWGVQIGIGLDLGAVVLDLKYEDFVSHQLSISGYRNGDFKNKGRQLKVGLGYKLFYNRSKNR